MRVDSVVAVRDAEYQLASGTCCCPGQTGRSRSSVPLKNRGRAFSELRQDVAGKKEEKKILVSRRHQKAVNDHHIVVIEAGLVVAAMCIIAMITNTVRAAATRPLPFQLECQYASVPMVLLRMLLTGLGFTMLIGIAYEVAAQQWRPPMFGSMVARFRVSGRPTLH